MQEATDASTHGEIFESISQIETVETICEYGEIISETEQSITVQPNTPSLLTKNPIHSIESQMPTVSKHSVNGKIQAKKNFLCKECPKRFAKNLELSKHVKALHVKLKDFFCDQCTFSTSWGHGLKSHKKSVHQNIRRYSCQLCDYKGLVV